MSILQSLILGIVEGITEFLPISSTGHLILSGQLLSIQESDFFKSFEIIIQFGAILSVVVLYWKSFLNISVLKKLIVAFIPTGIIGLTVYQVIKTYLLGNGELVLWAMLLGGAALIVFELWHRETGQSNEVSDITYKQAVTVGLCQAVAIIPGVSRSAATIIGGLFAGLKRKTIVEFSFLLAVPTMLAASGLDLLKNASLFSHDQFGVLAIGFITSFVVAILSIKFLLGFIKKHTFISFGFYRIFAAIIFWFLLFS